MKKPKLIYAIAIWAFLQQTFFLKLPLMIVFHRAQLPMEHLRVVRGAGTVLLLFVLVFLVRLASLACWITVGLLGLAALIQVKTLITVLAMGHQMAPRAYVTIPLMIIGNVACCVFLVRPAYGALCKQKKGEEGRASLDDINEELIKNPPKM